MLYNLSSTLPSDGSVLKEISERLASNHVSYASPFVIIQTIAYFELFNNMKIPNNKFINYSILLITLLQISSSSTLKITVFTS